MKKLHLTKSENFRKQQMSSVVNPNILKITINQVLSVWIFTISMGENQRCMQKNFGFKDHIDLINCLRNIVGQ